VSAFRIDFDWDPKNPRFRRRRFTPSQAVVALTQGHPARYERIGALAREISTPAADTMEQIIVRGTFAGY